jgi:predicted GNAT superfamily acetyltransferase
LTVQANPSVEIRALTSLAEMSACVALQSEIWGDDFDGVVPASLLKVATYVGGVVAGAFDGGGALCGFVFGITGVEQGDLVHWSHMLGVSPRAQRQGIGRALKEHQRDVLRALGVQRMYWTFDPLVARNAHFNFNVLGVRAKDYVVDMYGAGTSPMHRGIGTDRLIVSWSMNGAARAKISDARVPGVARIEVPGDIAGLQASDMRQAMEWRERTRAAFTAALSQGLAITGFDPGAGTESAAYILSRVP